MDKTTQERIKVDAEALKKQKAQYHYSEDYLDGFEEGYIAGATDVHDRAQKMADALTGCIGTIIFWYEVLSQIEGFGIMEAEYLEAKNQSIKRIEAVLQQWNGAGNEETKPAKIETCGHCGSQPASNYIGNQLYLCDECMEKHTEDCY